MNTSLHHIAWLMFTGLSAAAYAEPFAVPATTPTPTPIPTPTPNSGRDIYGHPLGTDVQGNPGDKNAEGSRPKDVQGHPPEDIYGNQTGEEKK